MIEITLLRHAFPEPNGLFIERPHGHSDYTLLHFFQGMKLFYKGKIIETNPGAVIIFNKGTPQFFENQNPIVHNWIHFKGEIEPLLNQNGLRLDTLYYPQNPAFITELTYEMEAEFYGSFKNKAELLDIKFQELIIRLGRAIKGQSTPCLEDTVRRKFQSLRGTVFLNLHEKWTTERMAEFVGFSPSRFYSIYKSIYNISPTNDLINARINNAKYMLYYEKKTVSEVALKLGYENTTHFIRQFKSKTGLSPTGYRKSKKSDS